MKYKLFSRINLHVSENHKSESVIMVLASLDINMIDRSKWTKKINEKISNDNKK